MQGRYYSSSLWLQWPLVTRLQSATNWNPLLPSCTCMVVDDGRPIFLYSKGNKSTVLISRSLNTSESIIIISVSAPKSTGAVSFTYCSINLKQEWTERLTERWRRQLVWLWLKIRISTLSPVWLTPSDCFMLNCMRVVTACVSVWIWLFLML